MFTFIRTCQEISFFLESIQMYRKGKRQLSHSFKDHTRGIEQDKVSIFSSLMKIEAFSLEGGQGISLPRANAFPESLGETEKPLTLHS